MPRLIKRTSEREDLYDRMHMEANKHMGPTRKEPMNSPLIMYILPDLAPMQKQLNKLENISNYEAKCARRRCWRK